MQHKDVNSLEFTKVLNSLLNDLKERQLNDEEAINFKSNVEQLKNFPYNAKLFSAVFDYAAKRLNRGKADLLIETSFRINQPPSFGLPENLKPDKDKGDIQRYIESNMGQPHTVITRLFNGYKNQTYSPEMNSAFAALVESLDKGNLDTWRLNLQVILLTDLLTRDGNLKPAVYDLLNVNNFLDDYAINNSNISFEKIQESILNAYIGQRTAKVQKLLEEHYGLDWELVSAGDTNDKVLGFMHEITNIANSLTVLPHGFDVTLMHNKLIEALEKKDLPKSLRDSIQQTLKMLILQNIQDIKHLCAKLKKSDDSDSNTVLKTLKEIQMYLEYYYKNISEKDIPNLFTLSRQALNAGMTDKINELEDVLTNLKNVENNHQLGLLTEACQDYESYLTSKHFNESQLKAVTKLLEILRNGDPFDEKMAVFKATFDQHASVFKDERYPLGDMFRRAKVKFTKEKEKTPEGKKFHDLIGNILAGGIQQALEISKTVDTNVHKDKDVLKPYSIEPGRNP